MVHTPAQDVRLNMLLEQVRRPPGEGRRSKVQRLHDAFLNMIERGFWRPGERMPGHTDLAAWLGLSLGTVQAAMRSLAAAGLIEPRRGAGTFVTDAQELGANVWNFRFRSRDGLSLVPFAVSVLAVEETAARGEWSEFLGAPPACIVVRRLIDVAREFRIYAEFYLEATRFRPLLDLPLDVLAGKNLRTFLHESYHAPTLRAVHRIRNQPIEAEIAALIGCAPGVPGLHMTALGYTYRNAPISFQRFYVPPNDYSLEILG